LNSPLLPEQPRELADVPREADRSRPTSTLCERDRTTPPAIERETGRPIKVLLKPRRAGDPPVLVADPAAARSVLGFKPIHSDLPAIIRSAWAWHQNAHPKRAI